MRETLEAEHAERADAHKRRVQVEQRLDTYVADGRCVSNDAPLTPAQLARWERDGYLVVPNAVPPELAAATAAAVREYVGADDDVPASWYENTLDIYKDRTPSGAVPPSRLFNIGNNSPVRLGDFIDMLERLIGIEAKRQYEPMQPGDVECTYADVTELDRAIGFKPNTSIEDGLRKFVDWYRGEWVR